MAEQEPKVRFYLGGEMGKKDFTEVIEALGSRMLGEIRMGQGELDFMQDMERETLKHTVSVQAARNFYLHLFQDKTPSPIATTSINKICQVIPDDEKTVDKHGKPVDMKRSSWDREITLMREGKSKFVCKPGSKTREFIDAFDAYLPKTD